jgi:aminopeptidase N
MRRFSWLCFAAFFLTLAIRPEESRAQSRREIKAEQARLRGSITPERAWWDVQHYSLAIKVDIDKRTLEGTNVVRFKVLQPGQRMQIDLQEPMSITAVTRAGKTLAFERNRNVFYVNFPQPLSPGAIEEIRIEYSGTPQESVNPPWSGGITWQKDQEQRPFIATSCQGSGASLWWPCKDHGYDESEEGVDIAITVPQELTAVANGRLEKSEYDEAAKTRTFHWKVTQPINNYCVNMNIGNYVNFTETHDGEGGRLDMSYWVLRHQRSKAMDHFKEAPRTIAAFEHWFGKYPFYEDSYKLVAVPYLGMEHQSSVTYGNGFQNGYRGSDLSATGVGLKFDFIIVHESGHEWFGNNISMKDAADMWIHEGFTNYSENLFVEYHFSKEEAEDYVIGCRRLVLNDSPIIGQYNRNQRGSGDMYYKAGNMLHTLRHMINDDEKWRGILRGLNQKFWHQTVTTEQIETYIAEQAGLNLKPFFDQYLRTIDIPKLEYSVSGRQLTYRFSNVVEGFSMPLRLEVNGQLCKVTASAQSQIHQHTEVIHSVAVDRNFYVELEEKKTDRPE